MAEQMFDNEADMRKDTAIPRFEVRIVENERQSQKQGEPVYENIEFVQIVVPGDNKNVVVTRVTDQHRARWPRQYEQFKHGMEQVPDGFPLEAWPGCPVATRALLKQRHCLTVQALAELPDDALPNLPNIYRTREKAREFLLAQSDAKKLNQMQAQIEEQEKASVSKDETIEELKTRLAALESQQEDAAPVIRRGRPPKNPDRKTA